MLTFDLGLTECQDRLRELQEHIHRGAPLPELDSHLYDYDLRPATNDSDSFDEDWLMEFAKLRLDDISDDEWMHLFDDESGGSDGDEEDEDA